MIQMDGGTLKHALDQQTMKLQMIFFCNPMSMQISLKMVLLSWSEKHQHL